MQIGLVGYQGSGKTTLFEWMTSVPADPSLSHTGQSAMAAVPDERVDPLCAIYSPKKITLASLEIVDTPGLSRSHDGNAARLSKIREVGCLVLVVAAYSGSDPIEDLESFEEDLLLADMEIVSGRVARLKESVKKPRPTRDAELAELAALEPVLDALEAGTALRDVKLNDEQERAIRSFRLLTEKPKIIIVNAADDDDDFSKYTSRFDETQPVEVIRLGLELELQRMEDDERQQFVEEMGLETASRDDVIRRLLEVSGQLLYFTCGEKEVRTWMLHCGGTALDAADNIHSDLARGFIRAETMTCEDLLRLGSEREIKAQNLMRQEPKDYVVADGDILHVKFNV